METRIIAVAGPTASGKSSRAVELALERGGEVISVDSRQVYRTLNIGTEKITEAEMRGIPHHLIDIRGPEENYSAGAFAEDAARLIEEIARRGKLPILAGGTNFYFDAFLNGLPEKAPVDSVLRAELEPLPVEELFARLQLTDARRAARIDPLNKRRLVRALEIISVLGSVPPRVQQEARYDIEWIVVDHPKEVLRERIDTRLTSAFDRGLIDETRSLRERVGDERLNEFGLEYRVVGDFLRGKRDEASLLPTLSAKLWQLARHQRAWLKRFDTNLRTLRNETR